MAVPYIGGILLDNIENNIGRERFLPDDPFQFSDRNFMKMYRLRKQDVTNLEEMLEPFLPLRRRQDALSNRVKILSSLRFFAGGSYQLDIGRNHAVTISQPSVSRSLQEVLDALNHPAIVNDHIHYPNTLEELRILRQSFFENTNIPGLVGIIDCTHINLVTPVVNEHVYVNRKNVHSLNVQMICDEKKKILNVNARFPGSTHDSFVWRNSRVEEFLRTLDDNLMGSFYLLGDSGYPIRPWLMTPYLPQPAPGTPEFRFNERMRQIRVLIERTFGELKNRFRCLLKDRVLHYAPVTVGKIVTACAVLHNICVENNVPLILDDNEDYVNEIENFENNLQEERHLAMNNFFARGQQIRNFLARAYF